MCLMLIARLSLNLRRLCGEGDQVGKSAAHPIAVFCPSAEERRGRWRRQKMGEREVYFYVGGKNALLRGGGEKRALFEGKGKWA